MKTLIIILVILTLTGITTVFLKLKSDKQPTITELTVMRDITDTHVSELKVADIVSIFNMNKWDGANFRFVDITDVTYNHTYEKKIEPENEWMGNELDRNKKVKQFYSEISQVLDTVKTESIGKDNSSVYIPIAHELNRLSQSTSQKRILLIYSDLIENTDQFSLYSKNNLTLLKTNPKVAQEYFENLTPLNNLGGIRIFFVFQPTDIDTDEQYKLISGFYKNLFESKGATVEITANIN